MYAGNLVLSDVRNVHAHNLASKPIAEVIRYLYPRLYQLHGASETMGTYDEKTGRLEMPGLLRSNYTWMEGNGIYLLGASNHIDDADALNAHR
jgi:hypothetical protein